MHAKWALINGAIVTIPTAWYRIQIGPSPEISWHKCWQGCWQTKGRSQPAPFRISPTSASVPGLRDRKATSDKTKLLRGQTVSCGFLRVPAVGDKFGESLGGSQAPPSFWEVPGLPRKFPEVPRKFSHCGTKQQSRGSPEVSRTCPEVSPFLWET